MEDEDIFEEDEEETGEQHPNSESNAKGNKAPWLAPYQFKKGQSGNPSGRPKGMSLKEWAKNYLASLTDEERLNYLEGLNKGTVWKMAEGSPEIKSDNKINVEVNEELLKAISNRVRDILE